MENGESTREMTEEPSRPVVCGGACAAAQGVNGFDSGLANSSWLEGGRVGRGELVVR